jgi:hypothetical protein
MPQQPAPGDGEVETGPIFGRAATGLQERSVDQFDQDPLAHIRFDRVRDLDQFARGIFGISEAVAAYFTAEVD